MAALEGVQSLYGTRGSSWYNALCIPCPLFLVRKQDMWWRNMSGFVWCVAQIRQLLALQVVTLRNRRLPEGFMGSAIVSDLARTTAPRLKLYNSFKHDCRIVGRTVDYSNIWWLQLCAWHWCHGNSFDLPSIKPLHTSPHTLCCRLSHSRVLGVRCHLWPAGFSQDFKTTYGLSCSQRKLQEHTACDH